MGMLLKDLDDVELLGSVSSRPLVATNGCFDILHVGHIRYLKAAKEKGHVLVVGLNSDRSIRELKGKGRPLISQGDRAEMLMALKSVDFVYIFDGIRCADFLRALRPDIYVKGGDYSLETLDESERRALADADILFVPIVAGKSTTAILSKINGNKN